MRLTDTFRARNRIEERSLAGLTTFRIGGRGTIITLERREDVAELAGQSWLILGGGANLLVDDDGPALPVVKLGNDFDTIDSDAAGTYLVGAGCPLTRLVQLVADQGFGGLESLAGVPGSVGGAVVMNAGPAQGGVHDVLEKVELFNVSTGAIIWKEKHELSTGYRDGGIGPEFLVLRAQFLLPAGDIETIQNRTRACREAKRSSQPVTLPSAGCVFKNPVGGPPAGKLIDDVGCKGWSEGAAEVSEMHANYIVNRGGATCAQVLKLIERLQEQVQTKANITLIPEVRMWKNKGNEHAKH